MKWKMGFRSMCHLNRVRLTTYALFINNMLTVYGPPLVTETSPFSVNLSTRHSSLSLKPLSFCLLIHNILA